MPKVQDLAKHYSRFRVAERLLLTGHSHQAWPDVAFEAQQRAWLDAAELVDDKWSRAAEIADEVRAGWRRLLNDPDGAIALGQNTHELVVRLLSAVLPMFAPANHLRQGYGGQEAGAISSNPVKGPNSNPLRARALARANVVTTDGEFHTIRRQLDRLAEEGIPVIKVAARPAESLTARLAAAVDDSTACVLVSSVLFETAEIVPQLDVVARACEQREATLLIDAYHHLNVVPFNVAALGIGNAFIVGGGYKYCQLGEGNCFLRIPAGSELRPVITGWFSEFAELAASKTPGGVRYGQGAARFAGATYDPTSHYRAAAVFAFHRDMGLAPARLRDISRHQVSRLREQFESLDIDPTIARVEAMPEERRGGFLAIRVANADQIVKALRERGMYADARGDVLRLGPAPYLADSQLVDAIGILSEAIAAVSDH